jgi:MFS family permease
MLIFVNEPKLAAKMQTDSLKYGIEKENADKNTFVKKPMEKAKRKALILLMASIALWFMGYNAVTTYFSKYCFEIMGMGPNISGRVLMIAQLAAIVTFIPSGIIAGKLGRKKTIMGGIILLTIAFGASGVFSSFSPLIYVFFVLCGAAWALINVNSLPMVVDLARNGEIGRFTGFYYTASMAAQIITPMLASTLMKIEPRILLPYGAVFVALSFISMIFVKHGDSKDFVPKKGLEAFED